MKIGDILMNVKAVGSDSLTSVIAVKGSSC